MNLADIFRTATRPIRTRSLESALIVVAVALGVGVVTAMLALILNGLAQERDLQGSLYARELIMVSRNDDYRGNYSSAGFNPITKIGKSTDKPVKFAQTDLELVRKACPAIKYAYLSGYFSITEKDTGTDTSRNNDVQLTSISREFIDAAGLRLLAGSWPTGNDLKNKSSVIAITEWYARQRFGQPEKPEPVPTEKTGVNKAGSSQTDPKPASSQSASKPVKPFDLKDVIGKTIVSKGFIAFKIVGVFAPPSQGFEFSNNQQLFGSRGIVPFGIEGMYIGGTPLSELKFLALEDQFDAAREQLRAYATRRFGEGVAIRAQRDELEASLNTSRNAALVTVLFASGGLVIAALNITNLMLARVLGRTRSIGISSALGASSRTIFALFLTESLVLGLLGGVLGMLLARGITAGLETSLKSASQYGTGMDLTLRPLHFVIGLLVALLISLLFGAYPAWMASRIRPSEALRG
jgi:ABC-type antimicrobial peptide transport system permease subunit